MAHFILSALAYWTYRCSSRIYLDIEIYTDCIDQGQGGEALQEVTLWWVHSDISTTRRNIENSMWRFIWNQV